MQNTQSFKNRFFLFLLFLTNNYLNAQPLNIIPYPNYVELQTGYFNLSASAKIFYDKRCSNEAIFLKQLLSDEHNFQIQIEEKSFGWQEKEIKRKLPAGSIYLTASVIDSDSMVNGEYRVKVDRKNIIAVGGTSAGVFYAIQSLRQIIKKQGPAKLEVP